MLKGKKIEMVFFDIDDTLMVKAKKFMPQSVPVAIKKLHENGIKVAIASGRAMYGIVKEVRDLNADVYVTINGQYVVNKREEIMYSNPLDSKDIEAVIAWCKKNDVDYGMIGANECVVSSWSPIVEEAMINVYGKIRIDETFYQNKDVYQMWTFSDQQLENQLPLSITEKVNVVRWHKNSCDIFPKNGSKANGIQKVLDEYGLNTDQIVVFGDGLNDIEMFRHAGFAVAMGESHPELLQYADYTTKSIEEHGVEYALSQLGLIK